MGAGVLFDVDGTLVDTNYLHVVAWWQAFGAEGETVPMHELHRAVGRGSDNFVKAVLGRDDERIAQAHSDFYAPWKHQLRAFAGAADLLRKTKAAGLSVVLATSASSDEADHLVAAIGAEDVIDAVTTKADVESSKPDPDVVTAALDKAGLEARQCLFVGDTVWDVEAASKAGLDCLCVLTGGIDAHDLLDAGAVAVYRDARHLLDEFDASPLGRLAQQSTRQ